MSTSRAASALGLVAGGAAYSWWVATTTPFTAGADLAVAVGFGLLGIIGCHALWRRLSHRSHTAPTHARPTAPQQDGVDLEQPGTGRETARGSMVTWVVVIGLFAVLELAAYFAGFSNRHAYPTLSSLYGEATGSTAAKAALVFAWIALGWGLFRR